MSVLYRHPNEANAPFHVGPSQSVCLSGSEIAWPEDKLAETQACLARFYDILRRYVEVAHVGPGDSVESWLGELDGDEVARVDALLTTIEQLNRETDRVLFEAIRAELTGMVQWARSPGRFAGSGIALESMACCDWCADHQLARVMGWSTLPEPSVARGVDRQEFAGRTTFSLRQWRIRLRERVRCSSDVFAEPRAGYMARWMTLRETRTSSTHWAFTGQEVVQGSLDLVQRSHLPGRGSLTPARRHPGPVPGWPQAAHPSSWTRTSGTRLRAPRH